MVEVGVEVGVGVVVGVEVGVVVEVEVGVVVEVGVGVVVEVEVGVGVEVGVVEFNQMNILGLDPATECGWALYTDGTIISGVWDLMRKNTLECGDHPILRLVRNIRKAAEAQPLDLIVFEAPIGYYMPGVHPGRAAKGLLAAASKCGAIAAEAGNMHCHFGSVSPLELKSFARKKCRDEFPPKGLGDKDCMFNAAKEYFFKTPLGYDEADALWVCEWAVENYQLVLQGCGQPASSGNAREVYGQKG